MASLQRYSGGWGLCEAVCRLEGWTVRVPNRMHMLNRMHP